jgi:hypothetical protein
VSPAEYRELWENRERADRAALGLYERVKARRTELLDWLHGLNRLEALAHDAGPTEASWEALALVFAERPVLLAELAVLENCEAPDLIRFLGSGGQERERTIEAVLFTGGLCDSLGRFVEVDSAFFGLAAQNPL